MRPHEMAMTTRAGPRGPRGWRRMPALAALLLALPLSLSITLAPQAAAAAGGEAGGAKRPPAGTARGCTPGARVALRPADAATTPPLAPDRPVCLRLQRGQTAFFRLAPGTGEHYTLSTRRLDQDTDTVLALLDAAGRTLAEDDDGGGQDLSSILDATPELGGALVRAGTLDNAGGGFELLLVRTTPPDFATSAAQAAGRPPLAEGQGPRLRLRRNQVAYFALPAERAGLVATTRNLQGDTDTVLALLDASGTVLAEDDDGGGSFASMLPLEDLAGSARLLRVATLGGAPGEFDLAVTREAPGPVPAFPTTLAAARERGPLAAGAVLPLELGRQQTAVFALPADQDLVALTRNLRGDTDTTLALLDANGAVLAEDDDGGRGFASRLSTLRASRRPAFLRVQVLNGLGGSFELVLLGPGGQPAAAPAAGTPAAPATSVAEATGRPALVPGEPVALRLAAGRPVVLGLPNDGRPGQALTFPLDDSEGDAVLELLDAEGQVLGQNDRAAAGLFSVLPIAPQPRPAFLRVRLNGEEEAGLQLVLVRAAP